MHIDAYLGQLRQSGRLPLLRPDRICCRRILSLRDQGRPLRARRATGSAAARPSAVAAAGRRAAAQAPTPSRGGRLRRGTGAGSEGPLRSGPTLSATDPSTAAASAQGRLRRRYAMQCRGVSWSVFGSRRWRGSACRFAGALGVWTPLVGGRGCSSLLGCGRCTLPRCSRRVDRRGRRDLAGKVQRVVAGRGRSCRRGCG